MASKMPTKFEGSPMLIEKYGGNPLEEARVLDILLGIGVQDKIAIITTACVAAGIFILIYLSSKKIVSQQVLLLGLSLIVFVESGASAYIGVKAVSVTNSFDYPKGVHL